SGIYATGDQVSGRAGCWTCDNGFQPARGWQQDVIDDARSAVRVVQGNRHSVHGNDFKCLPLKPKVEITICGSIHETPKLALTGSDFNWRPNRSIYCEDFFCRLWLRTTNIRTEFHALLQISRLRIVSDGSATHNQDAFRQASERRNIG